MEANVYTYVLGACLVVALLLLGLLFRKHQEVKSELEDSYKSNKDLRDTLAISTSNKEMYKKDIVKLKEDVENHIQINSKAINAVEVERQKLFLLHNKLINITSNFSSSFCINNGIEKSRPALRISLNEKKNGYILKDFSGNIVTEIIQIVIPYTNFPFIEYVELVLNCKNIEEIYKMSDIYNKEVREANEE